jgi:hypothetical protein
MRKFTIVLALVGLVGLAAAPAFAQQMSCEKMIGQIRDAAGNRFDNAAYDAKAKADAAEKAKKDGKAADCEKVAKEGLTLLGIKM